MLRRMSRRRVLMKSRIKIKLTERATRLNKQESRR